MFRLFLRHPVGPLHSPGFDVSRFVIYYSSGVSAISKPAQMIHSWSGRDLVVAVLRLAVLVVTSSSISALESDGMLRHVVYNFLTYLNLKVIHSLPIILVGRVMRSMECMFVCLSTVRQLSNKIIFPLDIRHGGSSIPS